MSKGGKKRQDLTKVNMTDVNFKFPTAVPKQSAKHSGEDVPIYAIGPQAHLFQGVVEQNYIPHVLGYAACIGTGKHKCSSG